MGRTWGSPCEYGLESSAFSGASLSSVFGIASLPFLFIIQFDLFLTIKGKPALSSCLQSRLLFLFFFVFLLLLFAVLG